MKKKAIEACEDCGKLGTVDDGHVLVTSGRLSLGTLRPHIFCRMCWGERWRKQNGTGAR